MFKKDLHQLNDDELESLFTELERLGFFNKIGRGLKKAGKATVKTVNDKIAPVAIPIISKVAPQLKPAFDAAQKNWNHLNSAVNKKLDIMLEDLSESDLDRLTGILAELEEI